MDPKGRVDGQLGHWKKNEVNINEGTNFPFSSKRTLFFTVNLFLLVLYFYVEVQKQIAY